MPIELHVDNDCKLTPGDFGLLIDERQKLIEDRVKLFNRVIDSYSIFRSPLDMARTLREQSRQREEICAAEHMVGIAILLMEQTDVSTISELADVLQCEINYGNPYYGYSTKDKAKAAQDIINLLQP